MGQGRGNASPTAVMASSEPWDPLARCLGGSARQHIGRLASAFLSGEASLARLDGSALQKGLTSLVPHDLQRKVATLAPTHFDAPSGSHVPIRYEGDWPVLSIRVQELFGLGHHPAIAGGAIPLTLELLSPAHRPIQTTRDLPGFWRGSWTAVRSEMRGRYPKHVWPEDPLAAAATNRAKPRLK